MFHRETLKGRRVLELGSGTGLCGLVAAKMGAEVTLTDAHAVVLELLEESASYAGVQVEALDWEAPQLKIAQTDIVIGSDVVYDPRLVDPLVNVLACMHFEYALICCAVRNESSLKKFETSLNERGLTWEQLITGRDQWEAVRQACFFTEREFDLNILLYRVVSK
jgi:cyclopropane fatty-acyl-phospholipid synthase-like methyltransferase